jgi:hypothetical protein
LPDPTHPGALRPIPIELDPDPHCTWSDVLATCDVVKAAKFDTLGLRAGWLDLRPFRCLQEAVFGDGELILPVTIYQEPDEPPADLWRPTLDLLQDGRVRMQGTVLHDPKLQRDDRTALRAALQQIIAEARKRHLTDNVTVAGEQREVVTAPILLRGDRYVEWRHVQKLLQDLDASQPRFAVLHIAVSERDDEASFVEQHQKPK